jgi:hypothetical protein
MPFLMPEGYTAPSGMTYFYESDLVKVGEPEKVEKPEFVLAESRDEAENYLKDLLGEGAKVDYSKSVTVEQFNITNKSLHNLINEYNLKYPLTNIKIVDQLGTKQKMYYGQAGHHRIVVNTQIFKKRIAERYAQLNMNDFHAPVKVRISKDDVDTIMQHIMSHEFAHTQSLRITDLARNATEIERAINVKVKAIKNRYSRALTNLHKELLEKQNPKIREEIKKVTISNYAKTNIDEFIAEAFVDYKYSSNPSPFSKEVYDLIFKNMEK